eukprot:GHVS01074869.1.p1 GENE.GHVS01074869.1~~GHVS01074869.1.p1  ORF type:complete len:321 (-),score=17.92 GHVS01074869.1:580-1542(-)
MVVNSHKKGGSPWRKAERDEKSISYWIIIFTCATTRAVHFELLRVMKTAEILDAIRKFIFLRGQPEMIISDNALQFQLSSKMVDREGPNPLMGFMLKNRIEWRFIPALSPWMGGFYERIVGITKTALKKHLMYKGITLRELEVVLYEISDFLNNRPITATRDDPEDISALRPKDFLQAVNLPSVWGEYEAEATKPESTIGAALEKRWQKSRHLVREVWQSWYKEYILGLRDYRTKKNRGAGVCKEPSVGEVVLMDDAPPVARKREQWNLGVITQLRRGKDGHVRVVSVRCKDIDVERPIAKLYPIERSSKAMESRDGESG